MSDAALLIFMEQKNYILGTIFMLYNISILAGYIC